MKKALIITLGGLLIGGAVYAHLKTEFTQRDVRDPRRLEIHLEDNFAAIQAGDVVPPPQTSSVTNGAVITLAGIVNNVTATEVSTNTVADPGTAGRIAILVNAGTNNIAIAKGANIALSAASHEITPDGTLSLVAASAAEWKETANAKGNTTE